MMRVGLRVLGAALLVWLMGGGAADAAPPNDQRPVDGTARLTLAYGGPNVSLDPHRPNNTGEPTYTNLIYDRLTTVSNDFIVHPMLAESWAFKDGGKKLEMKLRRDVTFHDGTRFDAQAVKANIERAKTVQASGVAAVLSAVAGVTVVDEFTVQFQLADGQGVNLPAILGTNAGMMISPKALADPSVNLILNPGLAGSGPYIAKSFVVNDRVVYERAPKHWDKKAGRLQELEIRYIPQDATRMNAFQAGQLDVGQILGNDMPRALQLAKSEQFMAYEVTSVTMQALFMRVSRPALKDVRVRRAIASAIDRKAIVAAAYSGHCDVATQPLPRSHWAYDPSLEKTLAYDPEKAKALLAEAGGGTPSFDIIFAPGRVYETNANLIQGMLRKVGITANLVPMPQSDTLIALRNGQRDSMSGAITSSADPGLVVDAVYLGGYNLVPEESRAELTQMAAKGLDPRLSQEQRIAVYRQLFRKVTEDVITIPLCFSSNLWAYKKNVIGIPEADGYFAANPDFRYIAVTKPR